MSPELLVAVPLGAALAATAVRGHRAVVPVGLVGCLLTAAVAVAAVLEVHRSGSSSVAVGGWPPPLGITLRLNGVAALFVGVTVVVSAAVTVAALGEFRASRRGDLLTDAGAFWPLWLFLWAALNAVFLTTDLFTAYLSLEVLTLAAVALVALRGDAPEIAAAVHYLLVAVGGSSLFLLGVGLLYAGHGTLSLDVLAQRLDGGPVDGLALALVTAGLAVKTALFPGHFWLPGAHARAPAPVSAALSGLVVKAAFAVVLRMWDEAYRTVLPSGAGPAVGALGAAAVGYGAVQALRQDRLKSLVAWSTVSQIGYFFVALALVVQAEGPGRPAAVAGVALLVVAHGLAKAALFLTAGAVAEDAGTGRIAALGPSWRRRPGLTAAAVAAAVSLVALVPGTGGYAAKSLLLEAARATGQWWWEVVLQGGSALTAAYVLRAVWLPLRRPVRPPREPRPVHWTLRIPPLALAVVAVVMGSLARLLTGLVER